MRSGGQAVRHQAQAAQVAQGGPGTCGGPGSRHQATGLRHQASGGRCRPASAAPGSPGLNRNRVIGTQGSGRSGQVRRNRRSCSGSGGRRAGIQVIRVRRSCYRGGSGRSGGQAQYAARSGGPGGSRRPRQSGGSRHQAGRGHQAAPGSLRGPGQAAQASQAAPGGVMWRSWVVRRPGASVRRGIRRSGGPGVSNCSGLALVRPGSGGSRWSGGHEVRHAAAQAVMRNRAPGATGSLAARGGLWAGPG
jgi:hypothetical protein